MDNIFSVQKCEGTINLGIKQVPAEIQENVF